jgi:glycine/D-amino acid oxidase-like deaminating enzyme
MFIRVSLLYRKRVAHIPGSCSALELTRTGGNRPLVDDVKRGSAQARAAAHTAQIVRAFLRFGPAARATDLTSAQFHLRASS